MPTGTQGFFFFLFFFFLFFLFFFLQLGVGVWLLVGFLGVGYMSGDVAHCKLLH